MHPQIKLLNKFIVINFVLLSLINAVCFFPASLYPDLNSDDDFFFENDGVHLSITGNELLF
jgi:hypothetical protein